MTQYITFEEAAQILGMTRESVRLYVKRGLLIQGDSYGAKKILKSSLDELMKQEYDVKKQIEEINKLKLDLEAEKAELLEMKKKNKVFRELLKVRGTFYEHYAEVCSFLLLFVEENGDHAGLSHREKEIASRLFHGANLSEIAEQFGLTRERVRQIYVKTLKKMKLAMNMSKDARELVLVKEELESLKTENQGLKVMIKDEERLNLLDAGFRIPESLFGLDNALISNRTRNVLSTIGIRHAYQITFISRGNLMRLRNFGRKSYDEVDRLMDTYNISLGNPKSLEEAKCPRRDNLIPVPWTEIEKEYEEFKKLWKR